MRPLHILARNLGRQPRFAGNTGNHWYTVLHHSFLVENIVSDMLEGSEIRVRDAGRLYSLIHDLHEGFTGDILTPFKPDSVREYQDERDRDIYAAFAIPAPHAQFRGIIKRADMRAMLAEALELSDPYCWLDCEKVGADWLFSRELERVYGKGVSVGQIQRRDREHVRLLLKMYGSHTLTTSIYSRGVQDFIREVTLGVQNCKRLREDWRGPLPEYLADAARVPTCPAFIPNPYEEDEAA